MGDYVTYEQAKKLKELGFDWKCSHYYECNRLTSRGEDISGDGGYADYTIFVEDLMYSANKNCPNIDVFDAPTLYQAQCWLIENKNLLPEPHYLKDGKWICVMKFLPSPASNIVNNEGEDFYSYQESLSRGITSCLKFLENEGN